MTQTNDELLGNFLRALSRHSYAASIERQEQEGYELWREEQDLLDQAAYEREFQEELERELAEEYERCREADAEHQHDFCEDDDPWYTLPWYQDPDIVGEDFDESEDVLLCEIRLNSRIRCQEGRLADHLRQRLHYGQHRGERPKRHRRGYDPDRRRQWRRHHRTLI